MKHLGMELLERRSLMAAVAWDGGAGDGLWSSPANWSTDAIPTLADDVTIDVPGQRFIVADAGPIRVRSLTLSETLVVNSAVNLSVTDAFDLGASADLRINGLINWREGTWNSSNTIRLQAGGKLNIGSSTTPDQGSVTLSGPLVNQGRLSWQGGSIQLPAAGSITNEAGKRFDIASQVDVRPVGPSIGSITNRGVMRRGGQTGTATGILVHIEQEAAGRTTILRGSLTFGESTSPTALSHALRGAFHIAQGEINFANDATHTDTSYTGAGSVYFVAGTHTHQGTIAFNASEARVLDEGTFAVAQGQTATIRGHLAVQRRTVALEGTLNVDGTLFLTGTQAQPAQVSGDGVARARAGGIIAVASGQVEARVVVLSGGTLQFLDAGQGGASTLLAPFSLSGALELRSATLDMTTAPFTNLGTIDLENSTLNLDVSGGALTNAGLIDLDASSQFNLDGDLSTSGEIVVEATTAEHAGLAITGDLTIAGGTLHATFSGGGFVAGQVATIFTFATRSGTFAGFTHEGLSGGLSSSLGYASSAINLEVEAT